VNPSELAAQLRRVRKRYDALDRGETAPIRRCRSASELVLESSYWRVTDGAGDMPHLAHVVLHFPLAAHRTNERFSFGTFLSQRLPKTDGATLRVRRLLDCRDRSELDHRLRAMLRLVGGDGAAVDWGNLGRDVLWFFAESDSVRRRWAQDYYAPLGSRSGKAASSNESTENP
jgi:CRISPR type I-E-associated protein CasB/Cse2